VGFPFGKSIKTARFINKVNTSHLKLSFSGVFVRDTLSASPSSHVASTNLRRSKMRFTRLVITIVITAAALTLALQNASAQTSTTGDLTGVVTDPTNAVVPSAQVTLKNLDQGGLRDTKTNDSGVYRFSLLQTGRYEVDIQASGFQPVARSTNVSIG
jgi:hypothetical protein